MISVVIPTYNDESVIASTILHLKENAYKRLLKEIIVVDAGSSDRTVNEAEKAGATVIHSIRKNHASQMNLGAQHTTGKILYFLFPGSLPPKNFTNEIVRATQKGYFMGTFSFRLDYRSLLVDALRWLTDKKTNFARVEEQSFFVLQELFTKAGSFREDYLILEDLEIIKRLKRYSNFIVLKDKICASTEKYLSHGTVRSEASYLITRLMYWMGYPQTKLLKVYDSLLGRKLPLPKVPDSLRASFN
jgi:glycosyltransferase involved in cell wall biosynthesis